MLVRKLAANPWRMEDFYSRCRLHPGAGWVRKPFWLLRCWQSRAGKLGGGCCAARAPAARGNCLPRPRPGPLLPVGLAQHASLARKGGEGQILPSGGRGWLVRGCAQPGAGLPKSGGASPLGFNLLWIVAIIIRIISSR